MSSDSSLLLYEDIPPSFREALCVWQAFRRIGFASDCVFFGKARTLVSELPEYQTGQMSARNPFSECFAFFVELHFRDKEFKVCAGEIPEEMDFETEWLAFAKKIQSGEHAEFVKEAWEKSLISLQMVPLMLALQQKGIPVNQIRGN